MSSVKELKKNINSVAGDLFYECLFCKLYIPGADSDKVDQVLTKILSTQSEFLKRANHPEGHKAKMYYKALKVSFLKQVEGIIDDIQRLNK